MNRKLLPILVLFTLAAGSFLSRAADEPANPATTEALIERLGSAQFEERERAAEALRTRGTKVLPTLRKAEKHTDPEVRRRVAELIPPLEAIAAVEPKRVTLGAEPQLLISMLRAIEKQTGYAVEVETPDDQKLYAVEMNNATFWEALEGIERVTNRVPMADKTGMKICLNRTPIRSPFVFAADSFRLELRQLDEERGSDFRKVGRDTEIGARKSQVTLTVGVLAEPKYRILGYDQPVLKNARDENGNAMTNIPLDRLKISQLNTFRVTCSLGNVRFVPDQMSINLQRTEVKTRTIKELQGNIPVYVAVARKDVIISHKFLRSEGTRFKIGDDNLVIRSASQSGINESYQLEVEVPDNESLDVLWDERIHLEDTWGERYTPQVKTTHNGRNGRSIVEFDYARSKNVDLGPPLKVVVEDWTILRHSIPFVFKDVPLP